MAGRYRTVDGMRGIAAMGVVVYHLSGHLKEELSRIFPDFVQVAFSYGFLGVPVFFVISGFVIALSVGDARITPNYTGMFIIRRSIRLDPTYWVAIGIAIILLLLKGFFISDSVEFPSVPTVFAHMFYLQDLLVVKPIISTVYWTLCLEVQLYLFYILSVALSQIITTKLGGREQVTHLVLIMLAGLYSLALDHRMTSINIPGLFIHYWHYFLMGVLVCNIARKLPYSVHVFAAWMLIELFFLVFINVRAYAVAGVLATLFIFVLLMYDWLNAVFVGKGFQYFGRLSYTLYLLHPDVGWKFVSISKYVLHNYMSPLLGLFLFFAGIAVSIFSAHLLNVLVEKPSLRLSARLKNASVSDLWKKALHRLRPA